MILELLLAFIGRRCPGIDRAGRFLVRNLRRTGHFHLELVVASVIDVGPHDALDVVHRHRVRGIHGALGIRVFQEFFLSGHAGRVARVCLHATDRTGRHNLIRLVLHAAHGRIGRKLRPLQAALAEVVPRSTVDLRLAGLGQRQVAIVELALNLLRPLKLLPLRLQLGLVAVDFFLYLCHVLFLLFDFLVKPADLGLDDADLLLFGQPLLLQPLILDRQLRGLPLHLVLVVFISLLPLFNIG